MEEEDSTPKLLRLYTEELDIKTHSNQGLAVVQDSQEKRAIERF